MMAEKGGQEAAGRDADTAGGASQPAAGLVEGEGGSRTEPPLEFDFDRLAKEDVEQLAARMESATRAGPLSLEGVLPAGTLLGILERAQAVLRGEPTLVEVRVEAPEATVTVVGDTHGQYHDVLEMFRVAGSPSPLSHFVINGDFVDRGAWSVETVVLLLMWKLCLPTCVTLLRGNHESASCNQIYGFRSEIGAKYKQDGRDLYKAFKSVFAVLPLGAVIQGATLVVHGGLFRKRAPKAKSRRKGGRAKATKRKEKERQEDEEWMGSTWLGPKIEGLGSLEDLRSASKGGVDPNGTRSSTIAADVLWSDPVAEQGLSNNYSRGMGLAFGPDVTNAFLKENDLKLVIRSHEGPDARDRRGDMPDMMKGFSVDHDVEAGRLMTIFSAPDYPQFIEGEERYHNQGAVAVLTAPTYAVPEIKQFSAVLPRPDAQPYYDISAVPESDEELPPFDGTSQAGSDAGGSEITEQSAEDECDMDIMPEMHEILRTLKGLEEQFGDGEIAEPEESESDGDQQAPKRPRSSCACAIEGCPDG
eukprot:evm.model.scf_1668.1 EVM.evm.TU.scf_1668.1   scf_1668:79-3299(+)